VSGVTHVYSEDVASLLYQLAQDLGLFCRGTQGADDFGLAHGLEDQVSHGKSQGTFRRRNGFNPGPNEKDCSTKKRHAFQGACRIAANIFLYFSLL
jgi:hypothetical protein